MTNTEKDMYKVHVIEDIDKQDITRVSRYIGIDPAFSQPAGVACLGIIGNDLCFISGNEIPPIKSDYSDVRRLHMINEFLKFVTPFNKNFRCLVQVEGYPVSQNDDDISHPFQMFLKETQQAFKQRLDIDCEYSGVHKNRKLIAYDAKASKVRIAEILDIAVVGDWAATEEKHLTDAIATAVVGAYHDYAIDFGKQMRLDITSLS